MGSLYMMTTIVDRKIAQRYTELYQENDLNVAFLSLGYGTVSNEILDYLGLESPEKAVAFSVLDEDTWFHTKKQLEKKLKIEAVAENWDLNIYDIYKEIVQNIKD